MQELQEKNQNTQEVEVLEKGYHGFYKTVWLILLLLLIFVGWTFTHGTGEQNLGAWIIITIIPIIGYLIVFVGAGLTIRLVLDKIFKNKLNRPVLATVLIAALVTATASYFFIVKLIVPLNSESMLFYYIDLTIIGLPAILISLLALVLKINEPSFWRLYLKPAIITSFLAMLILPLAVEGLNYLFTKTLTCNLVTGKAPQISCYRAEAIETGNYRLCLEKKLDAMFEGDCVAAIAVYKKNPSLCELVKELKVYDACLHDMAIVTVDKRFCDGIKNQGLKESCLNYKPTTEEN
ncbi:MAG: hypothetical protein UV58_C0020G0001 [Candidatus Wolfebacteria bacterium GW2011_GWC1_43_10]|uniref:Uncharacterized protein n=1 Tax=Candidatus Wolfebacteria bacterium GW2011_GWC1_43_10 TaxID=1619011 RepID=A0A0G1C7V3_9BACT|nr:MAG: hypothetical protein UV58_C0020G0001 [Candidatus Wolfebacteria bacterium GW2011_GWC1_43_10]